MVRAAYLVTALIGWLVIVPLSFAVLVTGLVQSLGTEWGLFRHYWVVHAAGGLVVLLTTTVLSVYKPWGPNGIWAPQTTAAGECAAFRSAGALPESRTICAPGDHRAARPVHGPSPAGGWSPRALNLRQWVTFAPRTGSR